MTELGRVIYSTGLTEESKSAVVEERLGDCPRKLLGLACVANEYECLCSHTVSASLEIDQHERGTPVARLTLELKPLDRDWSVVRKHIELVGFKADYRVSAPASMTSGVELVCSFDLYRPQNDALREHLAESSV